ncbi:uncharacterized protein BXZ73DRAFT_75873 [Epithele typhae]|uniref:uncharacterized protein n=1 Tax=Epithele typhae TaxID=378194 RepID=UPI00200871B5|nr:uncharacterized protein BXZ73DRAFT_75873 [Epithele typhae]KAH9939684.1 hypothetical protein BXZ73DRAFT_75873 [Epithele typhae]
MAHSYQVYGRGVGLSGITDLSKCEVQVDWGVTDTGAWLEGEQNSDNAPYELSAPSATTPTTFSTATPAPAALTTTPPAEEPPASAKMLPIEPPADLLQPIELPNQEPSDEPPSIEPPREIAEVPPPNEGRPQRNRKPTQWLKDLQSGTGTTGGRGAQRVPPSIGGETVKTALEPEDEEELEGEWSALDGEPIFALAKAVRDSGSLCRSTRNYPESCVAVRDPHGSDSVRIRLGEVPNQAGQISRDLRVIRG